MQIRLAALFFVYPQDNISMKALGWTASLTGTVLGAVLVCGIASKVSQATNKDVDSTLTRNQRVAALEPVAFAPRQEHDFGVMEPNVEGRHDFAIRNDGEGRLILQEAGKTCNCVGIDIVPPVVAPGETAIVRVRWETRFDADEFCHGGTVRTNDPENPEIKFRVNGRIKELLGTNPKSIIHHRILPDKSAIARVSVYSQEWTAFEITRVTSSIDSLEWEISPATEDSLHSNAALSGYDVLVRIPPGQPQGRFHEWMRFAVKVDNDSEDTHEIETPIHGNVIRRLSVRGSDVLQPDGTVYFGVIHQNQGAKTRLILQVNDEDPHLDVTSIKCEPSCLKATVKPFGRADDGRGLYFLEIEVPVDARHGDHLGVNAGSVQLEIEHPRIEGLTLKVEFSVFNPN